MELGEFLQQIRSEVDSEIADRLPEAGTPYPYPETIFTEKVMDHMAEIGMTFEPNVCHYDARMGNAKLRLSGYALSEDLEQLDLFVSLYGDVEQIVSVPDAETKTAAEQCLRFLSMCAEGKLASKMDESNDAYTLAVTIQGSYAQLDQIRIYVLTDRQAKTKTFKPRVTSGKTVKLEVMDIERLYRHMSEGRPRDELIVNFEEVSGGALPCIYVPDEKGEYDYALTVFPGEALRFLYEKYGARLLEANVRSFLNSTGKTNKGIRDTLKTVPERFMAYNNGIVVVSDEARLGRTSDGGPGLLWLKGMQIVNGGQTTASLYFTKKKSPDVCLDKVRVPAKVIILRSDDALAEESLIADISRYANSQNSVKQSDLSANRPFHVEIEKLSMTTYCPDGVGRWFYERAAGSYNTMLAREGTTPARLKHLKQAVVPPGRKITKTDLAKALNAWRGKPEIVSLGNQKNFESFMEANNEEEQGLRSLPDASAYKNMVAQVILLRKAVALTRPMFPAYQSYVATYLIALLGNRVGDRLSLGKIWQNQDLSQELRRQLQILAQEVHEVMQREAAGRMISEWAKKPEAWEAVRTASYSLLVEGVPELD